MSGCAQCNTFVVTNFDTFMRKKIILLLSIAFISIISLQSQTNSKIWVFVLAGQSNMAGRGIPESTDTITCRHIITINENGDTIPAREPLHFYEPKTKGVGIGFAFARELKKHIPDSVTILLIPTAVGGSSINQWIKNSTHRNVTLLSNFREKVAIGSKYGEIKAILWHQGESDVNQTGIAQRKERLEILLREFRTATNKPQLPVIMGEIGTFLKDSTGAQQMNIQLQQFADSLQNISIVSSKGLTHKGDFLHFDTTSQHELGKRFAEKYISNYLKH